MTVFAELLQHGREYELNMIRSIWNGQVVLGEIMADCVTYRTLERLAVLYPAGRYPLRLAESPRLKAKTAAYLRCIENDPTGIWIDDVPGREHIQIHPGCFIQNSDGCTLTGMRADDRRTYDSREAFCAIRRALRNALDRGQSISIEVREINRPEGHKEEL
jgi:hypothetical protein